MYDILQVEWKEKKARGVEEDISLQRKQLHLMEHEMKRRENEVEERENSILMELATMKQAIVEKDGKIENLNSDLLEVGEICWSDNCRRKMHLV